MSAITDLRDALDAAAASNPIMGAAYTALTTLRAIMVDGLWTVIAQAAIDYFGSAVEPIELLREGATASLGAAATLTYTASVTTGDYVSQASGIFTIASDAPDASPWDVDIGWAMIQSSATGSGQSVDVWVEVDPDTGVYAEVQGTRRSGYTATVSGRDGGHCKARVTLSPDYKVRVRMQRVLGAGTVTINQARIRLGLAATIVPVSTVTSPGKPATARRDTGGTYTGVFAATSWSFTSDGGDVVWDSPTTARVVNSGSFDLDGLLTGNWPSTNSVYGRWTVNGSPLADWPYNHVSYDTGAPGRSEQVRVWVPEIELVAGDTLQLEARDDAAGTGWVTSACSIRRHPG